MRRKDFGSALEALLDTAQLRIEARRTIQRALACYGSGGNYVTGLRNRLAGCRDTVTFDHSLSERSVYPALIGAVLADVTDREA